MVERLERADVVLDVLEHIRRENEVDTFGLDEREIRGGAEPGSLERRQIRRINFHAQQIGIFRLGANDGRDSPAPGAKIQELLVPWFDCREKQSGNMLIVTLHQPDLCQFSVVSAGCRHSLAVGASRPAPVLAPSEACASSSLPHDIGTMALASMVRDNRRKKTVAVN